MGVSFHNLLGGVGTSFMLTILRARSAFLGAAAPLPALPDWLVGESRRCCREASSGVDARLFDRVADGVGAVLAAAGESASAPVGVDRVVHGLDGAVGQFEAPGEAAPLAMFGRQPVRGLSALLGCACGVRVERLGDPPGEVVGRGWVIEVGDVCALGVLESGRVEVDAGASPLLSGRGRPRPASAVTRAGLASWVSCGTAAGPGSGARASALKSARVRRRGALMSLHPICSIWSCCSDGQQWAKGEGVVLGDAGLGGGRADRLAVHVGIPRNDPFTDGLLDLAGVAGLEHREHLTVEDAAGVVAGRDDGVDLLARSKGCDLSGDVEPEPVELLVRFGFARDRCHHDVRGCEGGPGEEPQRGRGVDHDIIPCRVGQEVAQHQGHALVMLDVGQMVRAGDDVSPRR